MDTKDSAFYRAELKNAGAAKAKDLQAKIQLAAEACWEEVAEYAERLPRQRRENQN